MSVASSDETGPQPNEYLPASGPPLDATAETSGATGFRARANGEAPRDPRGDAPRLSVVPDGADPADNLRDRKWPPTAARRGFGMALLGLASAGRFVSGHEQPISGSAEDLPAIPLIDVTFGLLDLGMEMGEALVVTISGMLSRPLEWAAVPARGPLLALSREAIDALAAATRPLAERGSRLRQAAEADAVAAVAAVLPESMEVVLDQVDLTDHAVVRVDFERVMIAAFDQIDMESLMIDQVDLARIVHASLSQIDLTELALKELDLERVVLATLEQVDVFSIARDQVDPVRVAAYLRDNVDLADVLRTAPGDAVRGVFDTVGRMVPGRTSD
jgi:hypothetical protein